MVELFVFYQKFTGFFLGCFFLPYLLGDDVILYYLVYIIGFLWIEDETYSDKQKRLFVKFFTFLIAIAVLCNFIIQVTSFSATDKIIHFIISLFLLLLPLASHFVFDTPLVGVLYLRHAFHHIKVNRMMLEMHVWNVIVQRCIFKYGNTKLILHHSNIITLYSHHFPHIWIFFNFSHTYKCSLENIENMVENGKYRKYG